MCSSSMAAAIWPALAVGKSELTCAVALSSYVNFGTPREHHKYDADVYGLADAR